MVLPHAIWLYPGQNYSYLESGDLFGQVHFHLQCTVVLSNNFCSDDVNVAQDMHSQTDIVMLKSCKRDAYG